MKKLTFALAVLLSALAAQGATVNWSAQVDTGFAASNNSALTQGNFLRIGYFTISDAAVAALAVPTLVNVASLNASFVEFGNTTVGQGFGVDGFFQKSSGLSYATNPTFITTSQIYIWALKATNNTSIATALTSATEQAIFYEPFSTGTSGNKASWQFPANDLANGTAPDIGDAKPSLGGVYLAGSYQASNPALTTILTSPAGAVKLQAVPEPSILTLCALAAVGVAGARRRSRKAL